MAWTVNISIGGDRPDLLYISAVYTDDSGNTISVSDVCAVHNYDTLVGKCKAALDDYNKKRTVLEIEQQIVADLLNGSETIAASSDITASKGPASPGIAIPVAPIKVG